MFAETHFGLWKKQLPTVMTDGQWQWPSCLWRTKLLKAAGDRSTALARARTSYVQHVQTANGNLASNNPCGQRADHVTGDFWFISKGKRTAWAEANRPEAYPHGLEYLC